MCGGVRRHVTQSWLERAQRAMHDALRTPNYDRREIDRSKQQLDTLLFARSMPDTTSEVQRVMAEMSAYADKHGL